jgi:hypothetical protein
MNQVHRIGQFSHESEEVTAKHFRKVIRMLGNHRQHKDIDTQNKYRSINNIEKLLNCNRPFSSRYNIVTW